MYYIGSFPVDTLIDLVTLCFLGALLALSCLSFLAIFHLHVKSRAAPHLRHFSALWTVRLLLVSFVSLWVATELLRVPCFRHRLSPSKQADLCKLYVILSLGFYEPGFLLTLLFLLSVSIRKIKNPHNPWPVLLVCLPVFLLQLLVLYFPPVQLPDIFHQTSIDSRDSSGTRIVLCNYPFSSTILFSLFGAAYSAWFVVSCIQVLTIVINKSLRFRICMLGLTVAVALPVQILMLGVSTWWTPDSDVYSSVTMVVFLAAMLCAAAGEGILVIRPIADALVAGGGDTPERHQTRAPSDERVTPEESSRQPLVVKVGD